MLDVLLFAAVCLAKFGENIKQNMLIGIKKQFQAVLINTGVSGKEQISGNIQAVLGS